MSAHGDVSVVVTNYNYGRYLAGAVQSALNQVGGPPHVIVVDDGSTEAATEAALATLPSGVTVIRQENAGPSAARNTGLAYARSPLLLVLDADDVLLPGALDALKPPLRAEPRLGFSYGITRFVGTWEGVLDLPPYDPYRLLFRHMVGLTALMRAELVHDTGGFDPSFKGYEDWELWLHALEHGWEGQRVDIETFLYRRHAGASVNVAARKRYRQIYRLLRVKHASLYARASAFASHSGASPWDRVVYPFYWGLRPVPALLEQAAYARRWRTRSG